MANYHSTTRSNYFQVKDDAAFEQWCRSLRLRQLKNSKGEYAVFGGEDESGWPNFRRSESDREDQVIDFPQELSEHLHDDYVAVLMEAGHEAIRYVTGQAIAINSKGKSMVISLDDIYESAKGMAQIMTEAVY